MANEENDLCKEIEDLSSGESEDAAKAFGITNEPEQTVEEETPKPEVETKTESVVQSDVKPETPPIEAKPSEAKNA
jgi:hypothetical protein